MNSGIKLLISRILLTLTLMCALTMGFGVGNNIAILSQAFLHGVSLEWKPFSAPSYFMMALPLVPFLFYTAVFFHDRPALGRIFGRIVSWIIGAYIFLLACEAIFIYHLVRISRH